MVSLFFTFIKVLVSQSWRVTSCHIMIREIQLIGQGGLRTTFSLNKKMNCCFPYLFILISFVNAAPLSIMSIFDYVHIVISRDQFECHCPGNLLGESSIQCTRDSMDPICQSFYASCMCKSQPKLFKRTNGLNCLGYKKPPSTIIPPKENGAILKSITDSKEISYEITELLKEPDNDVHLFNVYRVKDPGGNEFILREATQEDLDMSDEITVLKAVDQYVGHMGIPTPNAVVKIQPGKTMHEMMKKYKDDPVKLEKIVNGGKKALDALHEKRISHGDPHLGNIMVTEDLETFNAIDFGTSAIVDNTDIEVFTYYVGYDFFKYEDAFTTLLNSWYFEVEFRLTDDGLYKLELSK